MVDHPVQIEKAAELAPHILGGDADVERSILGLDQAVGADHGMVVADGSRHLAEAEVALTLDAQQPDESADQRGVDALAEAARALLDDAPPGSPARSTCRP